ncbi:MAG: isoamylase early set domain-containing protein [Candidatus Scalindua sediminis]|nr:isoamylase early set domain-containing protein [Candidatus Scalindua sediminis]
MAKTTKEKFTTLKMKASGEKTVSKKPVEKETPLVKVAARNGGIKKTYLKDKDVCRVRFKLPKVVAPGARSVCIVGDFNNWNIHENPMKKLKNGGYNVKLDLETGREYQFHYLIDGLKWENDWNADKYVKSSYGNCDNSVVLT